MVEIENVVKHLFHLALHVSKALQTTEVWDWLRTGEIPDTSQFPLDVREALTKYGKLKHHYRLLSGKLKFEERTERFVSGAPGLILHDCSKRELEWAQALWSEGDGWRVYYVRPEDGYLYQLKVSLKTGKPRWLRKDGLEVIAVTQTQVGRLNQRHYIITGGTRNE